MAYHLAFDHDRQLSIVTLAGAPTEAEVLAALAAVPDRPEFVPAGRVLVDARAAAFAPDAPATRRLAAFLAGHPELRLCPVAVAVGSLVGLGTANMLAILCGLEQVRVRGFQSYDQAVAWLCGG